MILPMKKFLLQYSSQQRTLTTQHSSQQTRENSMNCIRDRILVAMAAGVMWIALPCHAQAADMDMYRERYASRMNDNELMSKITDNRGDGFEDLYGTRNMRVVLHGIFYRGGGNNAYHRERPRDNMNPLPQDGLDNLCKEGFSRAVYLYDRNWKAETLACTSRIDGAENTLNYDKRSDLYSTGAMRPLLASIHACIQGGEGCPIYAHCWNGWHASGFAAAVVLRQFCSFSADAAVNYWIDGTDSPGNSNIPFVKTAIRNFVPYSDLVVDAATQQRICPRSPYSP